MLSIPEDTFTVPVLLKVALTVWVPVAVWFNVPVLFTVFVPV
jgi:hypothetical protein